MIISHLPGQGEAQMNIGDICTREVVCAAADTPVAAAAKLMRQYHIGDVIITQNNDGKRSPLGIVTDRDIVLGVVAPELAPDTITVGDIMGQELTTAGEDEDVFDVVQRMRREGVRRMPIVDADGALAGIVSIDDIIEVLAEEMNELARLISREQMHEQKTRK
jgi:CBS domain-containing protein